MTVFAAVQPYLVTIGIARCRDCPHSPGIIHRSGRVPGTARRHEVRVGGRRQPSRAASGETGDPSACATDPSDVPSANTRRSARIRQRRRCRSSTVTLRGDRRSPIRARSPTMCAGSEELLEIGLSICALSQPAATAPPGRRRPSLHPTGEYHCVLSHRDRDVADPFIGRPPSTFRIDRIPVDTVAEDG